MLKLSDFGYAVKLSDIEKEKPGNQREKYGNPNCMSPELFTEQGVYSFSSDIWGLGCILYEMATGK